MSQIRVTVLGAGPGGYVAAIRAAQLGAQVTIIEQDNLGGTCLNWGCIPTKTLKATAEALELTRRFPSLGIVVEGSIRPDMALVQRRRAEVISLLANGIKAILKSYRIRVVSGTGTILDPHRVEVTAGADGSEIIVSDKLILATGSGPMELPGLPFDGHYILSSDQALLLTEIPERLLILGGGVVGCEFGYIFQEFGAQVTIVEAMDRLIPLPSVDENSAKILAREMKKRKVELLLGRTAHQAEVTAQGRVKVTLGPSATETREKAPGNQTLEVDKMLVTVGRAGHGDSCGIPELGLDRDSRGWIRADDHLRTNVPDVFAVGDVLGPAKIMLAHVATTEGLVAAENALGGDRIMRYDVVPAAIFTSPEMADVGLTEKQAVQAGFDTQAHAFPFRALGKSQAMGDIAGEARIVSETKSGKILGIHLIGPHASDIIHEGALAIRLGATIFDLAETIHAHPTLSEAMSECAHLATGQPIHLPKPGRGAGN
ncbi:MAG: dihydrolipoyl dehydrogenase [Deltaproteobacteria bacterium]|nr:dihydrolipoyl dehydrogenase [Deltaproteobacteria bacterium]